MELMELILGVGYGTLESLRVKSIEVVRKHYRWGAR